MYPSHAGDRLLGRGGRGRPQVLQGNLGSTQWHKTPENVSPGTVFVCGQLLTKCCRSTVNHFKGLQGLWQLGVSVSGPGLPLKLTPFHCHQAPILPGQPSSKPLRDTGLEVQTAIRSPLSAKMRCGSCLEVPEAHGKSLRTKSPLIFLPCLSNMSATHHAGHTHPWS